MPLKIDGPAGRQEVSKEYRDNYDRIFNRTSLYFEGNKIFETTPEKSKKDGGNHVKSNS